MSLAACAKYDPDIWFSEDDEDREFAKNICSTCLLQTECYKAGKDREYGIWGGVVCQPDLKAEQAADRQEKVGQIVSLHGEGMTFAEIGRELDMPATTVRYMYTTTAARAA